MKDNKVVPVELELETTETETVKEAVEGIGKSVEELGDAIAKVAAIPTHPHATVVLPQPATINPINVATQLARAAAGTINNMGFLGADVIDNDAEGYETVAFIRLVVKK